MKNFVEDNKFVLIATFLEGLPSKVSKKFFDAAEFSGSSYSVNRSYILYSKHFGCLWQVQNCTIFP